MLCIQVEEEEREVVNKKVKLRGVLNVSLQFGESSFRIQKTPNIIMETTCLLKHIDWSDIDEPSNMSSIYLSS